MHLLLLAAATAAEPATTTLTIPVTGDIKDVSFVRIDGQRFMVAAYTAPETVSVSKLAIDHTPTVGRDYQEVFRETPAGWTSLGTDYSLAVKVSDAAEFGTVSAGRAASTTASLYSEVYPTEIAGPKDKVAFVYGFTYDLGPQWIQHGSLTVAVATIGANGALEISWHADVDVRGSIRLVYVDGTDLKVVTDAKGESDAECCPSKFLNVWLRWNGSRFVERRRCLADSPNGGC